jgi:hypothetical protein
MVPPPWRRICLLTDMVPSRWRRIPLVTDTVPPLGEESLYLPIWYHFVGEESL